MLRMFKRSRLLLAALVTAAGLSVPTGMAQAQSWPDRPVTIVVPFGPGAITDQAARLLAQLLREKFNQPFVVENRPGAGSLVGSRLVSNADPDGYTLMVTAFSVATLGLGTNNEFNPLVELTPITRIVHNPVAMMVPTSIGVNNVQEFIAYAKANPDKAFYGVTDFGSTSHVRHEQFNLITGTQMKPVQYQSGSQIVLDASQARLAVTILSVSTGQSLIDAGLLKVIGYAGEGTPASVPQAPTLREQGVDMEWASWTAVFAPPGMAPDLVKTIYDGIAEAIRQPEFLSLLERTGATPQVVTPEQFVAQITRERQEISDVMERTGIKPPN